ncbi:MAG: hypothetical protein U5K43_14545 [Halofilum sp. (in: g-proteobacteria)]|nr:hypothetical protein [Halofilum sp. (in: g-proteobacteria)]
MSARPAVVLLAALLLPGCAALERAGLLPGAGRPEAGAELVFLDRLAVAGRDELAALGEELRARAPDGDPVTELRLALWLATPGHAGHDAAAGAASPGGPAGRGPGARGTDARAGAGSSCATCARAWSCAMRTPA